MARNRVLESIRAGTRLSEARFSNLSTGGANQRSVRGIFVVGVGGKEGEEEGVGGRQAGNKEGASVALEV